MYYRVVKHKTRPKKKHNRKRIAIFLVVMFFAAVIGVCVMVYMHSMTPTILEIAQADIRAAAAKAVNDAVYSVMSSSIKYDDLVNVQKNSDNEVTLIQANSVLINSLARDTALIVQQRINDLGNVGVSIPVGTLSGIPLLAGAGPEVSITVSPIGAVVCSFTSEFLSAGINQTLHRIYLKVHSKVDVIIPTLHAVVETETPVLVSESIIVGKVPDAYLQGSLLCSTAA